MGSGFGVFFCWEAILSKVAEHNEAPHTAVVSRSRRLGGGRDEEEVQQRDEERRRPDYTRTITESPQSQINPIIFRCFVVFDAKAKQNMSRNNNNLTHKSNTKAFTIDL